jgi:hypothetical protein
MACESMMLKQVPLFALLDDDELTVLSSQVELPIFAPRQRIYKLGEPAVRWPPLQKRHATALTISCAP